MEKQRDGRDKARGRRRWQVGTTLLAICAASAAATLLRVDGAQACGWTWETYAAEATALPCVHDVIIGFYPKHTDAFHETMVEAADWALLWAPHYGEAMDQKGISLMQLKRYKESEEVMLARLKNYPDAYPTHANLGTLYTFTGEYDEALTHIEQAMQMEPKAHFGREGYHKKLVEYFQARQKQPDAPPTTDFLGLNLSAEDRDQGSPERAKRQGIDNQTFAALSAMLAVYGADGLPEMYVAFGNALALAGYPKLAFTAYQRARYLKSPQEADLQQWQEQLRTRIKAENRLRHWPGFQGGPPGSGPDHDIRALSSSFTSQSSDMREGYAAWERAQLRRGLAIWTQQGIEQIYKKMDAMRSRCPVGKMLEPAAEPSAALRAAMAPRDHVAQPARAASRVVQPTPIPRNRPIPEQGY